MLLISITIFQSCKPCNSVCCQNGGTCVHGKCQCPSGYEGNNCHILSRDKFLGKFQIHSKNNALTSWSDLYFYNIIPGTQNDEIIIDVLLYHNATDNNGGGFYQITCKVSGNNITSMAINSSNYSLQGTGNITLGSYNYLTLNYQVTDLNNSTVYNCQSEGYKQ